MPASDYDSHLRPGIHRTSAYSSSLTSAVRANWDQPIGDARSVRTKKRAKQVRQGAQVNRNTDDRTLHTYRIVPPGYARRVLCNLLGMLEPK